MTATTPDVGPIGSVSSKIAVIGGGILGTRITRELLTEVLDIDERDLPLDVLERADEAFVSSSTRDAQPVATVDGRALASCPGPLTSAAIEALARIQAAGLDP